MAKTTTRATKVHSKAGRPSPCSPDTMEALGQAAECLRALAHPVRLRMIQQLLRGQYTVGELAEDCGIPDNVASENLRLMQRCGFLASQRDGRRVYYKVAEPHLENIMACVEDRFLSNRR
jgi:ArsR family transcriptional regulator, zinc-responsive transcriptional repressor